MDMNARNKLEAKMVVGAIALGLCSAVEAKTVTFNYQALFSAVNSAKVAKFPLDLGTLTPSSITAVVRRGGVDVSTLGCSFNMAYRSVTDMMLQDGLRTLATYTATCINTVAVGDLATLTLTVNTTDPVLLIGGPSYSAGALKNKLSWQHDSGFGFCQAFTLNGGWDNNWVPWNAIFNSNTQGETVVSISPTSSSSMTFALQCDQHLRTVKMPVR
ncbi:MAG: hypothetical protein FD130_2117 [Halothiobacillaceae bacterium]|nr:MAG: hypothetical protein FD130_2117 [Halothiobacillaceae bacterium]